MSQAWERREERAHGDIVARSGDMVTLGDGARWWLDGRADSRAEVDAILARAGRVEAAAIR